MGRASETIKSENDYVPPPFFPFLTLIDRLDLRLQMMIKIAASAARHLPGRREGE